MPGSEDLIIRSQLEVRHFPKGISFVRGGAADCFTDVEQGGYHCHQLFVEVCKELPFLLVERGKVIGIVLEEGRLPVAAFESRPMLVTPVSMVADAYVAHHGSSLCLDDGNCQGECPRWAVYPATVAKRLFREMVTDLKAHFVAMMVGTVMRDGCKVAAGQKHLLDIIHQ